jgi:hypothetical protein
VGQEAVRVIPHAFQQLAAFDRTPPERVRIYLSKWCQCYPCWCGKCTVCGGALTKHAFTEDDARAEALAALERDHVCHRRDRPLPP